VACGSRLDGIRGPRNTARKAFVALNGDARSTGERTAPPSVLGGAVGLSAQ